MGKLNEHKGRLKKRQAFPLNALTAALLLPDQQEELSTEHLSPPDCNH